MAKTVRQKEINFLTVLAGRGARKKLDPRSLIMPGILLLIVIIGIGVFGYLQTSTNQVDSDSSVIREYLNSPDTNRQLTEATSMEAQAQNMEIQAESVAVPMDNLATYPDLTSDDYRRILAYAGANVELFTMSFDRTTGILSFTATSDYVLSIPTFISQLRTSGIFTDVNYSGYAGNVSSSSQLSTSTSRTGSGSSSSSSAAATDTIATFYAFSVECSVKPSAISPDETEEN